MREFKVEMLKDIANDSYTYKIGNIICPEEKLIETLKNLYQTSSHTEREVRRYHDETIAEYKARGGKIIKNKRQAKISSITLEIDEMSLEDFLVFIQPNQGKENE